MKRIPPICLADMLKKLSMSLPPVGVMDGVGKDAGLVTAQENA
jgi:hypothetical protein